MVQGMGSSPQGNVYWNCFSNYFCLSFMLGQVDVSDTAILCNRPNNCCQQNLKCFDEPLFSLGLFPRKTYNNSVNSDPACLICSSKFSLTCAHKVQNMLKWFRAQPALETRLPERNMQLKSITKTVWVK